MNVELDQEIYQQLKNIANKLMTKERNNHTLSPTDLVHEAFIKIQLPETATVNSDHYIFILARQMRRLLVDYGRQKQAQKRGSGGQNVIYTDALGINNNSMLDFSVISDAIDDLNQLDERAAQAVDLFYFTNISKEQAAKMLNISVPTLDRDLRFAKAQISHYLSSQS
jgi:RNA polymerase sigma factor (TIGR02999 family)